MPRRLAVLLLVALARPLIAHPEIEDALARLNARLTRTPGDPELLVERASLYARHEDWVNAEANLHLAAEHHPQHPAVARARGALAFAMGRPREALPHLDLAVRLAPEDVASLVLRARVQARLGDRSAAARDFDSALAALPAPSPELFLERAAVLDPPAALRSLDDAIGRIGASPSLQERAAALEEQLGRVDAAAARFTRLARASERPEYWFHRRGDLLLRAARAAEAVQSYREALRALAALPDWLRQSPETATLALRLQSQIDRLSTPLP